ncbi:MAG TPA: ATP-binding protein [Cytophagaceae bacterium]
MQDKFVPNIPVNILLVDDKRENLYALRQLLQEEGANMNFLETTSGPEALKIALEKEVALILLDVQMPEMDGFEVARLLKSNKKTSLIPVIFVTAMSYEIPFVLKGYEQGAVDYLLKPLNPAITRAKVKAFVKLHLQQKELEYKNSLLENLGLLVNNSLDPMAILSEDDFTISISNPSWENLLGYSPSELNGKPFLDLVLKSNELQQALETAKNNGHVLNNYECELIGKNGQQKWFTWTFVLKNGKWYGNGRDITERKNAEMALYRANEDLEKRVKERTAELIQANKELKGEIEKRAKAEETLRKNNEMLTRTNRDLDNFVYTASHDLKLPIANMEGLIQTLNEELGEHSQDIQAILDMLNTSVLQLKSTVQDLLRIIQIQKEPEEKSEKVDCAELMEEIKLSIKELIESSDAEIIEDFGQCTQLEISKASLKSIIYNLLTNAIKYKSPDRKPVIEIRLKEENAHAILSIKDNGLGINMQNKDKLFTMFKRMHDHVEGSGIGLYIVKRTVEKYGGEIEVESEVGKGSTFTIILPKVSAPVSSS